MSSASPQRIGWASVTPALLWTLVFFVLPFLAMAVMSLAQKGGGWSLAAYAQFFSNESYWRALLNSVEVTLIVTARSQVPSPRAAPLNVNASVTTPSAGRGAGPIRSGVTWWPSPWRVKVRLTQ